MPIKFNKHRPDCFGFARSKPACKSNAKEHRNQLNELTSFLDLSQVYGSDDKTAKKVKKNDGKTFSSFKKYVNIYIFLRLSFKT